VAKKITPQDERRIIISRPEKRPYGVRVQFRVLGAGTVGNLENISLPLSTGVFLTIAPGRKAPWEGGRRFVVTLEGFPTAASAEAAGRRAALSLLWIAVSLDIPLQLEYTGYEPGAVFERNRAEGDRVEAYGEVGWAPELVISEVQNAYSKLNKADPKLLLSMEIFCAARLESSRRAVFLALVSALEPLARIAKLGPAVSSFVDECLTRLRVDQAIAAEIKESLASRVGQLREESIRQALMRLAQETVPANPDAPRIIKEAYTLRSQLIHAGVPADLDVDLEAEGRAVSGVIREIYAGFLKQSLARSAR
jgi:hypothetical protein